MMNDHTLILTLMTAWNFQSLVIIEHARILVMMGGRLVSVMNGRALSWMKGKDVGMIGHASLSLGCAFLPRTYWTMIQ